MHPRGHGRVPGGWLTDLAPRFDCYRGAGQAIFRSSDPLGGRRGGLSSPAANIAHVKLWDAAPVRRMLGETGRERLRHRASELRWTVRLAALPPRVAAFQLRARRLAWRSEDYLSLMSVTRPRDLRVLLALARGRSRVVELGTATGWTTIALALDDAQRQVVSYDVVGRPEPQRYLQLVAPSVRARIELVTAPGSDGPRDAAPVDMLYIDSSHEREQTIAEVLAWRPVLAPGAPIVFDDYLHAGFPGVREAIVELGLSGEQHGALFVHRTR
jgi:predicted O-methyltransferase YrrM